MKRKMRRILAMTALICLLSGCAGVNTDVAPTTLPPVTTIPPQTTLPPETTEPPQTTAPPETTAPPATTVPPETTMPPTEPPTTVPPQESFILSFAGDCTLGTDIGKENKSGSYFKIVGDNYAYPLAKVKQYFENDDYTFVNLEGPLTDRVFTAEEIAALGSKKYRFKGPAAYVNILLEGSVEHASFANNHALDYGELGRDDTVEVLKNAGIDYNLAYQSKVFTTDSGLKIGVYTPYFSFTKSTVQSHIQSLRDKGAEVVVVSIHWGKERIYHPSDSQVNMAHMAIDAGANIVYGHHSHTLMPIEHYKDGIIYYSLGNFSFGGNRNPDDKDTAVLQQEILRNPDGSIELGTLTVIPCQLSGVTYRNDFQPVPYSPDDPHYARTLSKLAGTYEGTYEDNEKQ